MRGGRLSIWFLIGSLLLLYGILILSVGIYDLYNPSHLTVAMAHLHVQIWWGLGLIVLGGTYVSKFRPRK